MHCVLTESLVDYDYSHFCLDNKDKHLYKDKAINFLYKDLYKGLIYIPDSFERNVFLSNGSIFVLYTVYREKFFCIVKCINGNSNNYYEQGQYLGPFPVTLFFTEIL